MTNEEAIAVLEESKRQNEIMRDNPTTFWKISDMEAGIENAKKRILALDAAISAIRHVSAGQPLALEQLRELVEADRDGRCGIPPVKLHQRIYRVFDGNILDETVCKAIWEPFTPRSRWKVWVMGSGLPYYWEDCIGKTVFLTREAAEAALKASDVT